MVVENGGIHPAQERNGKITLTAGDHAIRVVYFDGGGNTALKVSWKGPDIKKQEIPAKVLSHEGQAMRPEGDAEFVVDEQKAAAGAGYYTSLQCENCHGPLNSMAVRCYKPRAQAAGPTHRPPTDGMPEPAPQAGRAPF